MCNDHAYIRFVPIVLISDSPEFGFSATMEIDSRSSKRWSRDSGMSRQGKKDSLDLR
jgi:hypothetical protein